MSTSDSKTKDKENTKRVFGKLIDVSIPDPTIPGTCTDEAGKSSIADELACLRVSPPPEPKAKRRPPPLQLHLRSAPIDIVRNPKKVHSLDPMDQYEFQDTIPSSPLTGRPPGDREGGCWPRELREKFDSDDDEPQDYFGAVRARNQETFSEPARSESPMSSKRAASPQEAEAGGPTPAVVDSPVHSPVPAPLLAAAPAAAPAPVSVATPAAAPAAAPAPAPDAAPIAAPPTAAQPTSQPGSSGWAEAAARVPDLLRYDREVEAWCAYVTKHGATMTSIQHGISIFARKMKRDQATYAVLNTFGAYLDLTLEQWVEIKSFYDKCYARITQLEHAKADAENARLAAKVKEQEDRIRCLEMELKKMDM
ncbi:hypothetical protein Dda_1567 [Drechslerella dactyloides]|uniref:Uncharacterized protein n=1 Tax=Drechslerella dactyloides TaxID=74499 RepID=A0AAD6J1Y1_DREDA|nr:hypothetical protein Dda_1567 [Drechslerella dactyloides]